LRVREVARGCPDWNQTFVVMIRSLVSLLVRPLAGARGYGTPRGGWGHNKARAVGPGLVGL